MAEYYTDNLYLDGFPTELKVFYRPLQTYAGVKRDVADDTLFGGGLAFLAFFSVFMLTNGLSVLTIPFALLAFFICILIPFLTALEAPLLFLFIIGFGIAVTITCRKSPAKFRPFLLTLLFAGWIAMGYLQCAWPCRALFSLLQLETTAFLQ